MDGRGDMIDRHRPVVSGDIPVELVVVFEKSRAVADAVRDLDGARRVESVGDIDLQVAKSAGGRGFVLELVAIPIGDTRDVEE